MGKTSLLTFELLTLKEYAKEAKFILEVGTGDSTKFLSEAAAEVGAEMISIDLLDDRLKEQLSNVKYLHGWSVAQSDMIMHDSPLFVPSRYAGVPDEAIVFGKKEILDPCDLIRKACDGKQLDFYFGDSGEYCGLAEWNIIKDLLVVGGFIALHDIHYPKSSKNFQVWNAIRKSDNWHIHMKTASRAGFMIAQKII